jgi:hypothetical protein
MADRAAVRLVAADKPGYLVAYSAPRRFSVTSREACIRAVAFDVPFLLAAEAFHFAFLAFP